MAGKPGRSGRQPLCLETRQNKNIDIIKDRVQRALAAYMIKVCDIAEDDALKLDKTQAQHLVALHIKHTKGAENTPEGKALDILERAAIAGFKEYGRVKAMTGNKLHESIVDEAKGTTSSTDVEGQGLV